jgi:hypothetical protein
MSGRSGSISPSLSRHACSLTVASLVTKPLVTPHTSGSVLKDARPCRIFQCRYLSKESGPTATRNLACFLWNPQQNSLCPRATHDSARPCCPRSRVAHPATPWRIPVSTADILKSACKMPAQEPFAIHVCVTARMAPLKDHVPPRADLPLRGSPFLLRLTFLKQTNDRFSEQSNALRLRQKRVYSRFTRRCLDRSS